MAYREAEVMGMDAGWVRFLPAKTPAQRDAAVRFAVRSAYARIPRYRRLLDRCSVSPSQIRGVNDLPRLPIVTKEQFHDGALLDAVRAGVQLDRCRVARTSGTTGVPILVYLTRAEALFRSLQVLRAWRRHAKLPLPLKIAHIGAWTRAAEGWEYLRHPGGRTLALSSASPVERQWRELADFRPHVITGAPSALDILCREAPAYPVSLPVRLIAVRGEVFHQQVRTRIQETFASPVADFYNCEEIGNIAWECPRDASRLHLNTDACAVEIVDGRGQPVGIGEEGEVLVTSLYGATMPFLRYAMHDRTALATPGGIPCACGSPAPAIRAVQGRNEDYIYLPSGRWISPRGLATAIFHAFPEASGRASVGPIRTFQVVQDAIDHVTVAIVTEDDVKRPYEQRIGLAIERAAPGLTCSVIVTDALEVEPSGKHRKILCRIPPGERPPDAA